MFLFDNGVLTMSKQCLDKMSMHCLDINPMFRQCLDNMP